MEEGDSSRQRTSLLVRNINPETTAEAVRDCFHEHGRVKDVYLPKDYYTHRPRGFGFVEFWSADDAQRAKAKLNGFVLDGRELEVTVARKGRSAPHQMRQREGKGGGWRRGDSPRGGRDDDGRRLRYESPHGGRRPLSPDDDFRRSRRSRSREWRGRSPSGERYSGRERDRYGGRYSDYRQGGGRDRDDSYGRGGYGRGRDRDDSCGRGNGRHVDHSPPPRRSLNSRSPSRASRTRPSHSRSRS